MVEFWTIWLFMLYFSTAPSFWFLFNSSQYEHGFHLTRFGEDYEVVSPLVAPPSCLFVVLAGCCIASRRLVVLLRRLVVALPLAVLSLRHPLVLLPCCHVTSPRPLGATPTRPFVAPPTRPLVALAGCCVASRRATLSSSCCLVLPLSLSHHASWLSQHLLSSSHCAALLSSHCAGWLLNCLFLRRPLLLSLCRPSSPRHRLAVVHQRRHQTPSNASAAIECHHHCHN